MDKETLEALEGSICKWDQICQGHGEDNGQFNCPLCLEFKEIGRFNNCNGCPVKEKSGYDTCEGTPYDKVPFVWDTICMARDDLSANGKHNLAIVCEKELIFLLELLPEGHRWRDQI